MTSDQSRRASLRGTVQTIPSPGGVVAVVARGFVSFGIVSQVLAELDRAVANDPDVRVVVLDVLDIDGFEPGVPARLIQWLGAHSERVRGAIVVTVSSVLIATVRAAGLLLPTQTCVAVPTRSEALSTATHLAGGRARASTGVRQKASAILASRKIVG